MEAEGHGSTQSTDSYIGSLISLTSKSEIRYEGVLFNINTEESSIGLRNVRSFGTEGRKKDGLQIPASDKIYEYILFRGSDIKDLQVKSSPPIYPMVPANHDTAIIQSQYSQPASTSTSITYNANASANDLGLQNSVLGLSRSTFETGYHSLQAGENLSSWGAFPATSSTKNSGLAIPMYWKGFNGYSTGVPSAIHQNPENPLVAQNLTSTRNSNSLPENPLVAPNLTSTRNSNSLPFPSIFPQEQATSFTSGPSLTSLQTKTSTISLSSTNQSASMQSFLPITNFEMNTTSLSTSISPTFVSVPPLPHQVVHPISNAVLSTTTSCHIESPSPITPDQLLPPVQGSSHSLFQSLKTENDVNVTQPLSSEFNNLISSKDLPSVLPLPTQTSYQRSTTTAFTEDFDFAAMNEKFNKDELWGHLGKDKEKVGKVDGPDNFVYEDHDVNSDHGAKLVYVKDDFFDSLSCNADQARGGRTRFSQQMKIDTETFGDISRKYRGNRGRCWVGSSGGHHRGSYHGRGGYGYVGRGRGRYV